jgi:transposase
MMHSRAYVGVQGHYRRFLNAELWILRSGVRWRFFPPDLAYWNSVFKAFSVGVEAQYGPTPRRAVWSGETHPKS